MPVDHFLIMMIYALLVSAFFALLWREERRERWKLFGILARRRWSSAGSPWRG